MLLTQSQQVGVLFLGIALYLGWMFLSCFIASKYFRGNEFVASMAIAVVMPLIVIGIPLLII